MKRFIFLFFSLLSINPLIATDTFYLDLAQYKTQNSRPSAHARAYPHQRSSLRNGHNTYTPNLHAYSSSQLKHYFTHHRYTEKNILSQHTLYMSDEFVKFAKTYTGYEQAVVSLRNNLRNMTSIGKRCRIALGLLCSGLDKRVDKLYDEIQNTKHASNQSIKNNYSIISEKSSYNCQKNLSLL